MHAARPSDLVRRCSISSQPLPSRRAARRWVQRSISFRTMNKMGFGTARNSRGQALVDAVYESLGYASNASGSWAPDDRGVRHRRRR